MSPMNSIRATSPRTTVPSPHPTKRAERARMRHVSDQRSMGRFLVVRAGEAVGLFSATSVPVRSRAAREGRHVACTNTLALPLHAKAPEGSATMSPMNQEVKGTIEQLTGRARQAIGKWAAAPALQASGERREALGQARVEVAQAAERVKAKLQHAAEIVLQRLGALAAKAAKEPEAGAPPTSAQTAKRADSSHPVHGPYA